VIGREGGEKQVEIVPIEKQEKRIWETETVFVSIPRVGFFQTKV